MKRSKAQHARLIELHRMIREEEYPNCLTFAREWEISQKTVQRDIDYLRDQLGAPLAYDRRAKGFYYTEESWMLPSVVLSEGELLAVMLGSRALAQYRGTPAEAVLRRVFDKLVDILPESLSLNPVMLFTEFSFQSPPAKPVDPQIWLTVVRSLISRTTVEIVYRRFDRQAADPGRSSRLNPYHIANLQGEWYVFGVNDGHDDIRQFAMPRIEKAAGTTDRYRIPAGFDPEAMLAAAFGRFVLGGDTHMVKLLFTPDVADWVTERQWHPKQTLKLRRDGTVELSFPAKGLFEVQRWVLSWGRQVTVLAPQELRDGVQEEIKAMASGSTP